AVGRERGVVGPEPGPRGRPRPRRPRGVGPGARRPPGARRRHRRRPYRRRLRRLLVERDRHPSHRAPAAGAPPRLRGWPLGVVPCRTAAHHFPELLPPLREVARVLTGGGAFLVEDILGHEDPDCAAFSTEGERRRDPSHVRAYSHREWAAFLRAAGLTVIDEKVLEKSRPWHEWTTRMRMTSVARAELERFVLDAPARCREAFAFHLEDGRIVSFGD